MRRSKWLTILVILFACAAAPVLVVGLLELGPGQYHLAVAGGCAAALASDLITARPKRLRTTRYREVALTRSTIGCEFSGKAMKGTSDQQITRIDSD